MVLSPIMWLSSGFIACNKGFPEVSRLLLNRRALTSSDHPAHLFGADFQAFVEFVQGAMPGNLLNNPWNPALLIWVSAVRRRNGYSPPSMQPAGTPRARIWQNRDGDALFAVLETESFGWGG